MAQYNIKQLHEEMSANCGSSSITLEELRTAENTLNKLFNHIKSSIPGAEKRSKEYWRKWYASEEGKKFLEMYSARP
ncbi:MAG: hypothetical protein PHW33_04735 [Candidatus Portnoybacteria bacterium]|nr:hypothetical protein [Candidatus Portnoybacteria bacterium]